MPVEKTVLEPVTDTATTSASHDAEPILHIGDTLTVVSGRLGGSWMVEDDNGVVYTAAPVE